MFCWFCWPCFWSGNREELVLFVAGLHRKRGEGGGGRGGRGREEGGGGRGREGERGRGGGAGGGRRRGGGRGRENAKVKAKKEIRVTQRICYVLHVRDAYLRPYQVRDESSQLKMLRKNKADAIHRWRPLGGATCCQQV